MNNTNDTVDTLAGAEVQSDSVPTEGKKRPGRPATYDLELFLKTFREVHASGGEVQAVADLLGMSKVKVGQIAAQQRAKGVDLPAFRRGRKPGQKNAPKTPETAPDATPETTETASVEVQASL
jgi:transposase